MFFHKFSYIHFVYGDCYYLDSAVIIIESVRRRILCVSVEVMLGDLFSQKYEMGGKIREKIKRETFGVARIRSVYI